MNDNELQAKRTEYADEIRKIANLFEQGEISYFSYAFCSNSGTDSRGGLGDPAGSSRSEISIVLTGLEEERHRLLKLLRGHTKGRVIN